MIALFVKIPFYNQLKITEAQAIQALNQRAQVLRKNFNCLAPGGNDLIFIIDGTRFCHHIHATEIARALLAQLKELAKVITEYSIILDSYEDEDGVDSVKTIKQQLSGIWYQSGEREFIVSERAQNEFSPYLSGNKRDNLLVVSGFKYIMPQHGHSFPSLLQLGAQWEIFYNSIREHGQGRSNVDLLVLRTSSRFHAYFTDAALTHLYSHVHENFLRLTAVEDATAFLPFITAFTNMPSEFELSYLPRLEAQSLKDMHKLITVLRLSPLRHDYAPALQSCIKEYISLRLKLYSKLCEARKIPAFIILENLNYFPSESVKLLHQIFTDKTVSEGLIFLATSSAPALVIPGMTSRTIVVADPNLNLQDLCVTIAKELGQPTRSAELLAAAEQDIFKLRLAQQLMQKGHSAIEQEPDLIESIYRELPIEYAIFSYTLALTSLLIDAQNILAFWEHIGFSAELRNLICNDLCKLELITSEAIPKIARPPTKEILRAILGDSVGAIHRSFNDYLFTLHKEKKIYPSLQLFNYLVDKGGPILPLLHFFLDCLKADLCYGAQATKLDGPADNSSPEQAASLAALTSLTSFFFSYGQNDAGGSEAALLELQKLLARNNDQNLENIYLLAQAYHALALGQNVHATIKDILLNFQSLGLSHLQARTLRILGIATLAEGKIRDGIAYLQNAYDRAAETHDVFEAFFSAHSAANAYLLLGDITLATRQAKNALDWVKKIFRVDWECAALFLLGRISFEVGRYIQAQNYFNQTKQLAESYGDKQVTQRATIWAQRCSIYLDKTDKLKLSDYHDDLEAHWFLAEYHVFRSEYTQATNKIKQALKLRTTSPYKSIDAITWTTGYDGVELLFTSKDRSDCITEQLNVMQAYTEAAQGKESERLYALVKDLHDTTNAFANPRAHLYYYYAYCVMVTYEPSKLEVNTMLSKSFKALLKRASDIDTPEDKDSFLELERWNSRIMDAVRKAKLV